MAVHKIEKIPIGLEWMGWIGLELVRFGWGVDLDWLRIQLEWIELASGWSGLDGAELEWI